MITFFFSFNRPQLQLFVLLIGILVGTFETTLAQKTPPKQQERLHEIGILLQPTFIFGIDYKLGTRRGLWRFSTVAGSGISSDTKQDTNLLSKINQHQVAFGVGYEWRHVLAKDFLISYGVEVGGSYSYLFRDDENRIDSIQINTAVANHNTGISLGLVLGFNYVLKDRFNFSISWVPTVNYNWLDMYRKIETSTDPVVAESRELQEQLNYTINWTRIRFVVAYRLFPNKSK